MTFWIFYQAPFIYAEVTGEFGILITHIVWRSFSLPSVGDNSSPLEFSWHLLWGILKATYITRIFKPFINNHLFECQTGDRKSTQPLSWQNLRCCRKKPPGGLFPLRLVTPSRVMASILIGWANTEKKEFFIKCFQKRVSAELPFSWALRSAALNLELLCVDQFCDSWNGIVGSLFLDIFADSYEHEDRGDPGDMLMWI